MIQDSPLSRRDPTIKLVVILVLSLLLVAVLDPVTPVLFLAVTCGTGIAAGAVRLSTLARALWPLTVVALGFVWSNAVFAVPPPGGTVWELGPVRASEAGLRFGLAIALRGLAIGTMSVVFVRTTHPTQLVVSLIRNARLSPRIGYALLAAYRFLPLVADEYEHIRLAQRVRGELAGGPLQRPRAALRAVLPLLAESVRRAARTAVAMDARGFAGARRRTYYRDARITRRDIAFAAYALACGAVLVGAGAVGGWLRLWDGRFTA